MPTPALRRGQTIWLRPSHRPKSRTYPALRGRLDADVVVVGGGLTGAMCADLLIRAGASVAVIEADRVGRGSTAASTALLLQEPDYDLFDLAKKYGPKTARRIWQLGRRATQEFIDTIRRYRIRCDLVERDSVYYTLGEERARRLRRELTMRRRAGLGGEWLDAKRLEIVSGMDGAGAILTRGNAQLNPLRACIGLIAAAADGGARIFERSPVTRIVRTQSGVRVHAGSGSIDARQVVIATGYATNYFKPLAGRFKMRRTYVLATNPISPQQRMRIGLDDVLLWDTERPYHYIRWTPDRRLLLGGEDRPVKRGANRDRQFADATGALRDYFYERYPVLREIGFAAAWEGLFAMTPDGLPYIGPHRRYPGHVFALGYGGNGMTFAALAARIIVEQWQGLASPDHALFAFNR